MSTVKLNLFWIVVFGLTLPIGIVVSTRLASRSFERVNIRGQTITVKGYAERKITSDHAMWNTRIVQRQAELAAAYERLVLDRQRLLAYFDERGFPESQVVVSPADIEVVYQRDEKGHRTNQIERYVVSQGFEISSSNVARIAEVARNASDLVSEGIELNASRPSYLYTRLDDVKLEMLREASDNGRERAVQMASGSSRLGGLRSASQGVFQITPAFSTEVSSGGMNDTTSIDKVIKAVVTLEFAID